MSATVAAALKKIAVAILTNPKVLKTIGGIVLGIIIIIVMPIVAVIGIFNGDINIDTDRLQQMVQEQQTVLVEKWSEVESAMTDAGFNATRVQEAQMLYSFALYNHVEESGFVNKFVGCFAAEQTNEELISAVNSAFGTNISVDDFKNAMASIRNAYINTSNYTDPSTKNNHDLEKWAEFAAYKQWGYVYGTYGSVLEEDHPGTDKEVKLIPKLNEYLRKENIYEYKKFHRSSNR